MPKKKRKKLTNLDRLQKLEADIIMGEEKVLNLMRKRYELLEKMSNTQDVTRIQDQ